MQTYMAFIGPIFLSCFIDVFNFNLLVKTILQYLLVVKKAHHEFSSDIKYIKKLLLLCEIQVIIAKLK